MIDNNDHFGVRTPLKFLKDRIMSFKFSYSTLNESISYLEMELFDTITQRESTYKEIFELEKAIKILEENE